MLTRREEDILILEIEEKNTELLKVWVEGKEGKRSEAPRDTTGTQRQDAVGVQQGASDSAGRGIAQGLESLETA